MSDRLFDPTPVFRQPAAACRTHERYGAVYGDYPRSLFRFGDAKHSMRTRAIASIIEYGGTDNEAFYFMCEVGKSDRAEELAILEDARWETEQQELLEAAS